MDRYILESYVENRKKIIPLLKTVKSFHDRKIFVHDFELACSKELSKIFKTTVPIKVIDTSYPQIFINCHLKFLKINVDYIYISIAVFKQFSPEEIVAALLHESGHYVRTKQNPSLVWKFFLAKGMSYTNLIFTLSTAYFTYIAKSYMKTHDKKKLYMAKLFFVIAIASIISMIASLYYYYSIGMEEYVSDSIAVKLGYGKELVSFIKQYKEMEDMYGFPSLSDKSREFGIMFRKAMQAIKLYPSDDQRICEIIKEIIDKTDKNIKVDSSLYKWAKEQYTLHCLKHVPVSDKKKEQITKLSSQIYSIIKSKRIFS